MGSFSPPNRIALSWAEAVSEVAAIHVPDEVSELGCQHFSDKELVDLTLAVVVINHWNRLAIAFRKVPGACQPAHQPQRRSDGVVAARR